MATPKPPKRYARPPTKAQLEVDRKANLEAQRQEQEEDDLESQPATPELIAKLGFNPDEDEERDPDYWPDEGGK
jgi:hypothetical protein